MNRKLRNLILVAFILVIAAGIALLVNELNIRSHFKKGNFNYQCYDYDMAINEYDKASEGYFLEGRDCPIRVNKSLAILNREGILDGHKEDWDIDTLNKNMETVEEVKAILLEDGCAKEDGTGHDAAAQKLYDDLCEIEREMEQEKQDKQQQQNQQNQNGGDGNDNQNQNGGDGNDNQNQNGGDGNDNQNQNGGDGKDDQNQNGGDGKDDQNQNGGDDQKQDGNSGGQDDPSDGSNGGQDDPSDGDGNGDDQSQNGGDGDDGQNQDGGGGSQSLKDLYSKDQNAGNQERFRDTQSTDFDWNFDGKCW